MTKTDTDGGLFDLKGRIVVITGGLGQLGRSFTRALLEHGARVAVFDVGDPDESWREGIGRRTEKVLPVHVDVTDKASVKAGLHTVRSHWGETPYGLINNAAIDAPPDAPPEENGPFETYPEASFDRIMEVNVKGVFLSCQVIGSAMAQAGRGSIVNVSSTYGILSPCQDIYDFRRQTGEEFFKPVAYSVSKSAILNLSRYLGTYWGDKGVITNTIVFGGVFNNQAKEFLAEYSKRVPLRRMAAENEYDGAMVFLMSDAASYMTGSIMTLDGGWSAW